MVNERSPWLVVLAAIAFAAGCLAMPSSPLRAQAPAATAAAPAAVSSSYILAPNDHVQILVYQEDDLTTNTLVSKEGTINFPLLGAVKIAGMTQLQAKDRITELLRADYLVNPQVSMSVVGFSRKRFTMLGQVQRPGSYDMPDQESIDLLEAIGMAGGYTRIAQPAKVTVKRRVGGSDKVFVLDAKKMARDPNAEHFSIQQGDTITVAETIL